MPRGHQDWNASTTTAVVQSLTDLGELAARLGSLSYYHRGGQIVLLESFEQGFAAWLTDPQGTGSSVGLSTVTSRHGGFSMRLIAGSDGGQSAAIARNITPLVFSRFGIEASFALDNADAIGTPKAQSVDLALDIYDGTNLSTFILRLIATSGVVQAWTTGGVYQTIGTIGVLHAAPTLFHTAKFVADPTTGRYTLAFIGPNSLSVSAVPGVVAANTSAQRISVLFRANSLSAAIKTTYWDGIVITQNEP